MNMNMNTNIII